MTHMSKTFSTSPNGDRSIPKIDTSGKCCQGVYKAQLHGTTSYSNGTKMFSNLGLDNIFVPSFSKKYIMTSRSYK